MRLTAGKKMLKAIIILILIVSVLYSTIVTFAAGDIYAIDYSAVITPGERLDIPNTCLFYDYRGSSYYWGAEFGLENAVEYNDYTNPGLYVNDGQLVGARRKLENRNFYFESNIPGTYEITVLFWGMNFVGFSGWSHITIIVANAITSEASNVTVTEATLNGRADAGNFDATVAFEYGTDTGYGSEIAAVPDNATGTEPVEVSGDISGLTPNTTYHYRTIVRNEEGTYYGEDKTFTTLPVLPVTTVGEVNIAASGVTLNGTVNANNSDTAVIFKYGLDENYGNEIPAQPNTVTGMEETPVSALIEGLEQNTTYHYRIKCENDAGIEESADYTFTTPYFAAAPTAYTIVKNGTIKKDAVIILSSEEGAEIYYTTAVNDDTPEKPLVETSAHVSNGGAITLPELAPGDKLKIKAVAAVPSKGHSLVADISYNVQPKAELILTGIAVNGKVYDGNTIATADFTAAALVGIAEGDSVELSGNPSAAFITAAAEANKDAVISGYLLTGADTDYYYIDTTIPTTASVTRKALDTGTIVIADKQYDGSTAAAATSIPLLGAVGIDVVHGNAALATAVFTSDAGIGEDKPVNVSNIQLAGEDADNYYLTSTTAAATGNILPKTLSVNITIAEKKFDGTIAATITGASLEGIVGEDVVTVDYSTATAVFDSKSVGNSKLVTVTGLVLSGAEKDKYIIAVSNATVGNVTAIGKLPAPYIVETEDIMYMWPYINSGTRATITSREFDYGSNTFKEYPNATIYYEIWANNFESAPPMPNASSRSIKNGEKIQVTGNQGEEVYIIAYTAQEGYENSDIGYIWFQITPKPQLSVTGASATDKDYDGTDLAVINAGALSGYIIPSANDVRINTAAVTGHFSDKNAGDGKTVTVSGYALTGTDAQFYELLPPLTTYTADIKIREVNIGNILINDKVYDGTTTATIFDITYSGKVGSEDVYIDFQEANAAFINADYGNGKTVNVTGLKLAGADSGNYRLISTTASATGNILPTGTAAAPSINLPADSLLSGTQVTLGTITEGAGIYYTMDGSVPDRNSSLYTEPILITGNPGTVVTVKAITLKAGMVDSPVMTKQYAIAEPGSLIINAIPGNKEIKLSWAAVPGTKSYAVLDSQGNSQGNGTPAAEGTYEYTASGLTNGRLYTYTVKAIDAVGRITNSSQAASTPRTIPGAPVNVNAAAGNGFVTVNFTAPGDNGGSPITGYVVKSNQGNITASGTDTAITVRGFRNGTVYSFTVFAINAAGNGAESLPSNSVAYFIERQNDSEGSSEVSTPANTRNSTSGNVGTGITTTEGTNTAAIFTVDANRLAQSLEKTSSGGVVTVDINSEADTIIGQLTGDMIRDMENKKAVLEVSTGAASYRLPAEEINIDGVLYQLGSNAELKDIKVNVEISKPSEDVVKVMEDSASKDNFKIVVPPIEFNVTCTHNGRIVSVSAFNSFVERTVAIPDGADPSKITTGVVIEPDGTVRHVPTKIILIEGKYYARINSLTNSTYMVIEHSTDFKDTAGHWAKGAIDDMGSRMIIRGVDNDRYAPERDITRAEFTAIVVRALGLKQGVGTNAFTDVKASDWYCDYIKTACEYKLISGGTDKFYPMDSITREQAMVILSRAMDITGLKGIIGQEQVEKLLGSFKDNNEISGYAKESIADCVKAGIVTGKAGRIASKDNITRAEVAVMIQRLLKSANLI